MSVATVEERSLTETDVRLLVDRYLTNVLGPAYNSYSTLPTDGSGLKQIV